MKQLPEFQVIEPGEALSRVQPHVMLAAGFDPLVIFVVYTGELRHLLLGQVKMGTELAQAGGQVFQGGHALSLAGSGEWEHPRGVRCLLYFEIPAGQREACN